MDHRREAQVVAVQHYHQVQMPAAPPKAMESHHIGQRANSCDGHIRSSDHSRRLHYVDMQAPSYEQVRVEISDGLFGFTFVEKSNVVLWFCFSNLRMRRIQFKGSIRIATIPGHGGCALMGNFTDTRSF